MGVLGLTPFLQKTCPEVIKQLPDRFRGLSGKKIVIDGTLVAQRFHFAQAPHPYRHVLGWYRLIKELDDAGVSAVCVFDGKERNFAKAREAERRKEAQRVTAVRGSLENERSERFRRLSNVLHRLRNLDATTKERAAKLLRQLSLQSDASLNTSPPKSHSAALNINEVPANPLPQTNTEHGLLYDFGNLSLNEPKKTPQDCILQDENAPPSLVQDMLYLKDDVRLNQESTISSANVTPILEDVASLVQKMAISAPPPEPSTSLSTISKIIPPPPQQPTWDANPLSTTFIHRSSLGRPITPTIRDDNEDVLKTLASLYLDYRRSKLKLATLAAPITSPLELPSAQNLDASITPVVPLAPLSSPPVADSEIQTEVVMSKAQLQLTIEEGHFWEDLSSSPVTSSTTESTLATLTHTSDLMVNSYKRRANPPTSRTYDECREILQAMGIPCLETDGAFEAEALAASMVLNGQADYVASEDTDVLIYEAPLIRNLTNRQGPLITMSGADVRDVLQLSRASFIDFALLLGTDFSQRIKNVGPARALKFIKEHGSIEHILKFETKYPPNVSLSTYMTQVETARTVFRTLPPVPKESVLERGSTNEADVVLQRYGLGGALMASGDWDYSSALDGNYFEDNPSAT